jgi:hypothetical protein
MPADTRLSASNFCDDTAKSAADQDCAERHSIQILLSAAPNQRNGNDATISSCDGGQAIG